MKAGDMYKTGICDTKQAISLKRRSYDICISVLSIHCAARILCRCKLSVQVLRIARYHGLLLFCWTCAGGL